MDDDDDFWEYQPWMAGPEAQMWSEQAKWEAVCEARIDRLWRSLPPIAWPGIARYQHLQHWTVVKRYDLKRWRD